MLIADEDFQRIELLLSINSIFYPKEESMEIFYGMVYGCWVRNIWGLKYFTRTFNKMNFFVSNQVV